MSDMDCPPLPPTRMRQPLTQELLNSMMREPGEAKRSAAPALPSCPQCGERYCGDGVQLCTECAAPNARLTCPQGREEST